MLAKSILFLATAALSMATPVRRQRYGSCRPNQIPAEGATPTLPMTLGETELSTPPETSILKAIALGHGIQNYTCGADLTTSATGALAVLYDILPLYPGQSDSAFRTTNQFNKMTVPVLFQKDLPLNLEAEDQTSTSTPATSDPFPAPADLVMGGTMADLPYVGVHYFDSEGVPTFDLRDQAGLFAQVKKDASTAAPAGASAGVFGTGAVGWLELSNNGNSENVDYVYRVNTAGGVAVECSAEGEMGSVPYTAMYWFFGPDAESA